MGTHAAREIHQIIPPALRAGLPWYTVYVWVCLCVLPISTGQVRSRSASSHSWSRTDPAPLGHATLCSPIHPLTYSHKHTNATPSPSQTTNVGRTQGSCYPPYVSQQQGCALRQCFVFWVPVCARSRNIILLTSSHLIVTTMPPFMHWALLSDCRLAVKMKQLSALKCMLCTFVC